MITAGFDSTSTTEAFLAHTHVSWVETKGNVGGEGSPEVSSEQGSKS